MSELLEQRALRIGQEIDDSRQKFAWRSEWITEFARRLLAEQVEQWADHDKALRTAALTVRNLAVSYLELCEARANADRVVTEFQTRFLDERKARLESECNIKLAHAWQAQWQGRAEAAEHRLATIETALRAFLDATATGQKDGIVDMWRLESRAGFYERIAKVRAQAIVALDPPAEREVTEKKEQI